MSSIRLGQILSVSILISFAFFSNIASAGDGPIIATVKHTTRVKILQSNNVTLRPGSVYDNVTYFESLLDFQRPGFNYEFVDSGLGAAEPLYPMYQKGFQGSWFQLFPAFFSENNRHIDHYTTLDTPEGCRVDGIYLLRALHEYPDTVFVKERQEGYTLVVIRLEYYTRLHPDAQCGRHRANDPDPNFDPVEYMEDHHNAMSLDDFPQDKLALFEAKLSVIYHIKQEMSPNWPRFNLENLKNNTLWYYPDGHAEDYGINTPVPQPKLSNFSLPKHLYYPAPDSVKQAFTLDKLVNKEDFGKVLDFQLGKPTPDFDPATEPGQDTLNLHDVTPTNFYTSGLSLEPIQDAIGDVSDPAHYQLVGMTLKPYEDQMDESWDGTRVVPQIRFVYQLMDPRHPGRSYEQLYLHVQYDVVDRYADQDTRDFQHFYFLQRVDQLVQAREKNVNYEDTLQNFIQDFTQRSVQTIAFSSSMTGIWIFGALNRDAISKELRPVRIIRDGVDVGYYSSVYDNDIFRAEIEKATGDRKALLQKHMDDITVRFYRDPKRQDPHAIYFNRMTCAQCHQTSARDGVHVALNDGIDTRITTSTRATEFLYRESERQLQVGQSYWNGKNTEKFLSLPFSR